MPAGIRDSDHGIGVPDRETTPRAQHAAVPLLTTHCVSASAACAASARLCSEKNYRLQDIQLSKIPRYTASRLREFARHAASLAKFFCRSRGPPALPSAASARHPSVARHPKLAFTNPAHLRQGYGGHPSRVFASEGWWRIPGSNR